MRPKFATGVGLLVWQCFAAALALSGQAEALLANVPDPAWFAALLTLLVSPPEWLMLTATLIGIALIIFARRHRRRDQPEKPR